MLVHRPTSSELSLLPEQKKPALPSTGDRKRGTIPAKIPACRLRNRPRRGKRWLTITILTCHHRPERLGSSSGNNRTSRSRGVMRVSLAPNTRAVFSCTCEAKDAAPIKCPNLVDFVRLAKPKPRASSRNWASIRTGSAVRRSDRGCCGPDSRSTGRRSRSNT
jgi:hypothetical protein